MKRLFIFCISLIFIMCLVGCDGNKNCKTKNEEVTLSKETETYIKQCVISYHTLKNPSYSKNIDDIIIKQYFGNFDGVHIAVILGDVISRQIQPIYDFDLPYYGCFIENISYKIKFLPEIISVYYENTYHTLIDACDEGMITKEILDQLDCYY